MDDGPEQRWLERGRAVVVEGWPYDKAAVAPGAVPELVWARYPVACIWRTAILVGSKACTGTTVYCDEDVPVVNTTEGFDGRRLLERTATMLEFHARERPGAPASRSLLVRALALRSLASDPGVDDLPPLP